MRSDEEVALEGETVSGVDEFVVKIDAPICRESQIVQFQKCEELVVGGGGCNQQYLPEVRHLIDLHMYRGSKYLPHAMK